MLRYILKRLLIAVPMLFVIALMTFVLMRISPGNYLDTIRLDPQISPETIAHYEKLYHLDQPLLVQYVHWVKNLLQFLWESGRQFIVIIGSTALFNFLPTSFYQHRAFLQG